MYLYPYAYLPQHRRNLFWLLFRFPYWSISQWYRSNYWQFLEDRLLRANRGQPITLERFSAIRSRLYSIPRALGHDMDDVSMEGDDFRILA